MNVGFTGVTDSTNWQIPRHPLFLGGHPQVMCRHLTGLFQYLHWHPLPPPHQNYFFANCLTSHSNHVSQTLNQVVVSNVVYFHPYLGKFPNLTNIFQMGWNHQLVNIRYIYIHLPWMLIIHCSYKNQTKVPQGGATTIVFNGVIGNL